MALRILSLSPHYFFPDLLPEYGSMDRKAVRLAEYERNRESRSKIYRSILKPMLPGGMRVMDYGCGPGLLARAIATDAEQVYGVDISAGVLACARVLNPAPNLLYVQATERGMAQIPDAGLDAVVSFALVQHLTDQTLRGILARCHQKLRSGGRLIFHVSLGGEHRLTEAQWAGDRSAVGRVLYSSALHCFSRNQASLENLVRECGFTIASFAPISTLCDEHFDDVCREHLLTAVKG